MKTFFIHFLAWWLFVLAVINIGACIFRYTTNGIENPRDLVISTICIGMAFNFWWMIIKYWGK